MVAQDAAMESSGILLERLPVMRKSLRIAFVTETYPPEVNGVSLSVARFVEGLRRRNHEIQLVRPRQTRTDTGGGTREFQEVLMRGMAIPRYPGLKMGLPAKRALTELWSVQRPDLVHIVTEGPLGWSALQAATKLRLPVTSDFRTNFHAYSTHYGVGWLKKPIATYLRKFHNRTLMTMVPTEYQRNELANLGFRNLKLVARGVDTQLFNPARRDDALRRAWGAGPDDIVAMHVGRIAPEKNLGLLSDAYEALRERQPRMRLVMVGDGPGRAAMQRRHPDAIFAGMRRGEELAAHYASADVFLFPSLTETFGNVTLEAMASGLAVLAYNYAAASEVIVDGRNGHLAPVGDGEAFVRAAAVMAGSGLGLRATGAAARISAQGLDWEHVILGLEALLLSVSAGAPALSGAAAGLAMPESI
jgi:glycosyltransferase involved in cell wall biosynthesis